MKIYIASPLGFSESGRTFYEAVLLPMMRQMGHAILDPWTLVDPSEVAIVRTMSASAARVIEWKRLNHRIAVANENALRECDLVVAILDGTDVDSGTAAEIGFAAAIGKRILGYRGDFRSGGENEGSNLNLQVEHFVRSTGGEIVFSLDALRSALRLSKSIQNDE